MARATQAVDDRRLRRRLKALSPAVRKAVEEATKFSVLDVETEAKRMIQQGPKTGIVRVVTKAGKTHQASAPGEAPATDTGFLVSNITHEIDSDKLGGKVVSRAIYSRRLELGPKGKPHLARPFLRPALQSMKKRILKRYTKALNAGARKAAKK